MNIYKAIYCVESYICERGLLGEEDLELYYRLHDKFDFEKIESLINECQKKLKSVLNPNDATTYEESTFKAKVFFRIKKYKEGNIVYRPMHTATLRDQICMAAMLIPLMFDDSEGKRKRSELSKIIPHDFYGNLPGLRMEDLFRPWMRQYKAYSEGIIEKSKEYRANRKYNTEVTLDLQEFFPSVSPAFIFRFVVDKLSCVYTSEEDRATLKSVLHKLLFLRIEEENIKDWGKVYYGEDFVYMDDRSYFTRGIPQGLPQSYLFGNLCMIEVKDILLREEAFRTADTSFYVDDSVIYIEKQFEEGEFLKTIETVNKHLADIGGKERTDTQFLGMLTEEERLSFDSLKYSIKFHDSDKSEYCDVEDTGFSLNGLEHIARSTSMASRVFENLDEIDDRISQEKLREIDKLVGDEIDRVEESIALEESVNSNDSNKRNHLKVRLKMLNRYKRFFLYRLRWLEKRLDESKDWAADFKNHFKIERLIAPKEQNVQLDKFCEDWFKGFDRDIFQSESRLLISSLPYKEAKSLLDSISKFEKKLTGIGKTGSNYLYFKHDLAASFFSRRLKSESYRGLEKRLRKFMSPQNSLSIVRQKERLEKWLEELVDYRKHVERKYENESEDEKFEQFCDLLPDYTHYVFINSEEYVRKILNTYCSIIYEVIPSDAKSFTKITSRGLSYAEFRILIRLRNRNFKLIDFIKAVGDLDVLDLDNRMQIDMGLLEVVGRFIKYVKNPEYVDNIILTHRITKSLWYNGSKFMNSYTLHNEEHAVTLIKWIVKIVNAIDYFNIKSTDYYILFLACYLHDISMVIHPQIDDFTNNDTEVQQKITKFREKWDEKSKPMPTSPTPDADFKRMGRCMIDMFNEVYDYFSNKIRKGHAVESASWIRRWRDSVLRYLEPLIVSETAFVAESHSFRSEEVYGLTSRAANETVGEKYMMILIRLADLMDVANDRINYNLLRQNVKYLSPTSRFHWISHLITDEIRLEPTYEADSHVAMPIEDRKIKERLNINLYLNVEFMAGIDRKCKVCRKREMNREIVKVSKEYEGYDGITLDMFGETNNDRVEEKCPLLCRWCMMKHEWMVMELKELNRYLNCVNDRLFYTEIRLNILYKDNMTLDGDLYHDAQKYIQTSRMSELDREEDW